ncbi:MAG: Plug and carboxypeptidase regulatory-like domain-containing protein, partial [Pyrinomonadaceae bacterium]|nr:Plug and carboxypeptidase regulatory-like domain-containing protein [Pyrinomonadaceae bacterium]
MDKTRLTHTVTVARLVLFLLISALALATPLPLSAQQKRGDVSGVVNDATGAVVNAADVSVNNSQQVVLSRVRTDAEGHFQFSGIPQGSYVVLVSHPDFSIHREVVQITAGGTAELNISLQVNQISESVTVTSEAGLVADARSVAQPVNIIDADHIVQRATEVVAQVVDEEPGVNLQRTSPSLSAVFVRGLTGRNVAVYVDGVRYTTSAQRGGVGTFFSLIEPSSLETVEILRGPNSSQYGSDVLGGVV